MAQFIQSLKNSSGETLYEIATTFDFPDDQLVVVASAIATLHGWKDTINRDVLDSAGNPTGEVEVVDNPETADVFVAKLQNRRLIHDLTEAKVQTGVKTIRKIAGDESQAVYNSAQTRKVK